MKRLVCIIVVALTLPARAQDTIGVYTYGGDSDDFGQRIFQTDSGYVLFGTTASFGKGTTDIYIVQTDKEFNTVASKTLGSWDIDRLSDVDQMATGFVLCGYTNTESIGNYTGKVWKLDNNLDLVSESKLEYGQVTIPGKILATGQSIYVGGWFSASHDKYFITRLSQQLQVKEKKEFEFDEIGKIESWIWNDNLVMANLRFIAPNDSVGEILVLDSGLQVVHSFLLEDSVGIAHDIRLLSDSNYLLVGSKIDTAINDSLRFASVTKINRELDSVFWNSRFHYQDAGAYVEGVKGLEVENKKILLIGNTDFQSFEEKTSVLATEYDSNGVFIPGNGFYFGFDEYEWVVDAISTNGDTVVAIGYTDSYGAGKKDMMIMYMPRRNGSYGYVLQTFEDTLEHVLQVREVAGSPSNCLSRCFRGRNYTPLGCNARWIRIYNTNGQLVRSIFPGRVSVLDGIPPGLYLVCSDKEAFKLAIGQ